MPTTADSAQLCCDCALVLVASDPKRKLRPRLLVHPAVKIIGCRRCCCCAHRWLRGVRSTRMFMSLVAVESSGADSGSSSSSVPAATRIASRDILGCVTLTVRRAEAQLPPPFPSKALPRLYVCNMAVSASFRRRGIARAMLLEAERIGEPGPHCQSPSVIQATAAASSFLPVISPLTS